VQCNIDVAPAKDKMRGKADSDLVRRQNRHIVLEALRSHGPMARVELGRLTGLSPASITTIANQLIGDNAMLELDETPDRGDPSRRGRPITRVDLNPNAARVIAIKISIGGVEMALVDFSGSIIARKKVAVATYEMAAEEFGNQIKNMIGSFLDENKLAPEDVAYIGVAAQGVTDSVLGTVAWSPAFKQRNIPVIEPIETEFGIKCSIANDANMIAEGVMAADRYSYTGTAAVVFMGYGVGMGLVIDGKVFHGSTGAAAEFGHMNHIPNGASCRCSRAGCLEAYASDYGILRSAENHSDQLPPPSSAVDPAVMRALESAARSGDANAAAAYAKAGRAIGYGLARMIALLNPDRIVLAGPGTRALDLIEPALRAAIEEGVVEALRTQVKIETAPIYTDMILTGTIAATLRHLDSEIFSSGPMPIATDVKESAKHETAA
jgi:predicted NBD/HSP70 family sugar kinase